MNRPPRIDPFFRDQPEKSFLDDLVRPLHDRRPSFFSDRAPEPGEADVRGMHLAGPFPDDGGLLDVSYADFGRFLASRGMAGDRYPVRLVRGDSECFEAYRVEVGVRETVVTAADVEGVRRALVWLEDELTLREGPCLPLGATSRRPFLRARITRCFFSPINRPPKFGDELSDDVDYYPENYLLRLMHDGANGVWVYTRLSDLVPVRALPEYGRGGEARLAKLNRVVAKCARYGIRVYVFAIEPAALDEALARRVPEADGGASWGGRRLLCVNAPEGRALVEEACGRLFERCPALGGLISITCGERPTSCSSAYSNLPEIGRRTDIVCPRCRGLPPGQALANAAAALAAGVHRAAPEAEVVSWTYGHRAWPLEDVRDYVRRVPEDVVPMQNFEELGTAVQFGRIRRGVDYWLSYAGPSPLFEATAREALAAGRRVFMKTQVCCSHEVATVPYVPVPGLLFDKYRAAHALGVSGVMQCWYFGNYPSLMGKAAGELAFERDFSDKRAFLRRLAGIVAGRGRAEAVAGAWASFEAGYREVPLNVMFSYYGPMHDGPVWRLRLRPANLPLPRSWQTVDPTDGDRIGECLMSGHTLDEAVTLAGRMARRWSEGCARLAEAARGRPELDEQVSDAGALGILFASGHDILRFYRLREKLGLGRGDPRRTLGALRAIVRRERARSLALARLCEADGRLGYHSEGEGYKFFPKKLAWRVAQLDELLRTEFPEVEARIARGLPPLAYYAGEERDPAAYRMGRGGIGRAAWEPVGGHAAFRCAYDAETLVVELRSDRRESVGVGMEFRLLWPAPPVVLHPDGRVEVSPEVHLHQGVFGSALRRLRRLWRVEALPAKGVHLRVSLSRKESGWTEDRPLKMRVAWEGGAQWCAEENPVHTLGKSTVSPGEYGWLLP